MNSTSTDATSLPEGKSPVLGGRVLFLPMCGAPPGGAAQPEGRHGLTKGPVAWLVDKGWFGGQAATQGVMGRLAPVGSLQPQPRISLPQVWAHVGQGKADTRTLTGEVLASLGNAGSAILSLSSSFPRGRRKC